MKGGKTTPHRIDSVPVKPRRTVPTSTHADLPSRVRPYHARHSVADLLIIMFRVQLQTFPRSLRRRLTTKTAWWFSDGTIPQ